MRIFLFCLLATSLFSTQFSVQCRGGYFYPAAALVRDVYRTGGGDYEAEASLQVYRAFTAWTNFNYFFRKGSVLGEGSGSFIRIYPLSFGFKYKFFVTENIDFYLGGGASSTWVRIHDYASHKVIWKQAGGIVGKTGFLYYLPNPRVFFDVFFDYYFSEISDSSSYLRSFGGNEGVNIGGLRGGLGLGVLF